MIVESSYRGYRIEVNAERVDGAWDATVRLRRVLTDDKPYVERVTCRKVMPSSPSVGPRSGRGAGSISTGWISCRRSEPLVCPVADQHGSQRGAEEAGARVQHISVGVDVRTRGTRTPDDGPPERAYTRGDIKGTALG
jgi:hypothetical protein